MACGRVIISSDLPVLREVLREDFAFLLPSAQVQLWVDTLKKIAEFPGLRKEMGGLARREACKYSWQSRAMAIMGN
jgi:glycosyltransferase involved in cell wall biosynthesis